MQEEVDPCRYCQMAVAAVIMGDLNAVYAVESAHRRQPMSVGSLQTRSMLLPGCAFPRTSAVGDVYKEDLVIIAMVHFSRLYLNDDFVLVHRADALYESPGIVVSAKICGTVFEHEVWGGQLDGKRGKLSMLATETGPHVDSPAMIFDDSSVSRCTHSPSGAKRCPFWTSHSSPSNVSRHDVVVPSTVPDRRHWSFFDSCVSRALDPGLRFLRGNRVLSEVGLGRRLPDWWLTCCGSEASRTAFGTLSTSTFLSWRPSSASFED